MSQKNSNKDIFAISGRMSRINKDGSKKSKNDILEFFHKNSLTKDKLGNYAQKLFGSK